MAKNLSRERMIMVCRNLKIRSMGGGGHIPWTEWEQNWEYNIEQSGPHEEEPKAQLILRL